MLAILKIVGLVLLAFVLIVGIGGYILLRKVKKFLGTALEGLNSSPPIRISLLPETNPDWRSPKEFSAWTEEFKGLGFQEVGIFSIPEMNSLTLKAFFHPGEQLYGVIYDHKKIAPNFDIVCSYEDGRSLTGTSSTFGETVDPYPHDEKIRIDTSSVAQVFDAVLKAIQTKPRKAVSPEEFSPRFLRAYKEETYWRIKKGGSSREEIRRQAKKDNIEITEEQLEETYSSMREQNMAQLREACVAQFLDDSKMPVVEWELIEQRILAVPETLDWKELLEILENETQADEEQQDVLKNSNSLLEQMHWK